jgi:hypothetical protein
MPITKINGSRRRCESFRLVLMDDLVRTFQVWKWRCGSRLRRCGVISRWAITNPTSGKLRMWMKYTRGVWSIGCARQRRLRIMIRKVLEVRGWSNCRQYRSARRHMSCLQSGVACQDCESRRPNVACWRRESASDFIEWC